MAGSRAQGGLSGCLPVSTETVSRMDSPSKIIKLDTVRVIAEKVSLPHSGSRFRVAKRRQPGLEGNAAGGPRLWEARGGGGRQRGWSLALTHPLSHPGLWAREASIHSDSWLFIPSPLDVKDGLLCQKEPTEGPPWAAFFFFTF